MGDREREGTKAVGCVLREQEKKKNVRLVTYIVNIEIVVASLDGWWWTGSSQNCSKEKGQENGNSGVFTRGAVYACEW